MAVNKRPLQLALRLIEEERYRDARVLLEQQSQGMDIATRWLKRLDSIDPLTQPSVTEATRRDMIGKLRAEIGDTHEELSLLNEAIKDAEAWKAPADWVMLIGFFLLPFFGIGLLFIGYATIVPRRQRKLLSQLQIRRERLLDDIESKYTHLATVREARRDGYPEIRTEV